MRLLIAALMLAATASYGAVELEDGDVTLYRSGRPQLPTHATYEACRAELARRAALESKASGYITWACRQNVVARYSPTPVCPDQPAPRARVTDCPSGFTGAYTQTSAYTSAPYPQCWVDGSTWVPSEPPADVCLPVPPPELIAPNPVTASAEGNAIALTWASVFGASAYQVQRCTGASCTSFSSLWCESGVTRSNTNLPVGSTFRYRVRASRSATCSSDLGPWSSTVSATTTQTEPPPSTGWTKCADEGGRCGFSGTMLVRYGAASSWTEPREYTGGVNCTNDVFGDPIQGTFKRCETRPLGAGTVTGTAIVEWTPPTTNVDGTALQNLAGYRVYYGSSSAVLDKVIQVQNPNATSYVVSNLAAGTYYFAVTAYKSDGVASDMSNITSKVVQ